MHITKKATMAMNVNIVTRLVKKSEKRNGTKQIRASKTEMMNIMMQESPRMSLNARMRLAMMRLLGYCDVWLMGAQVCFNTENSVEGMIVRSVDVAILQITCLLVHLNLLTKGLVLHHTGPPPHRRNRLGLIQHQFSKRKITRP
mmetsp:Transcript_10688/g.39948  ORF Transcript_10688/g.39948 Transcript_10688/m.39948 type:complete len:144 (+) Transcript_10688:956-1387(+)